MQQKVDSQLWMKVPVRAPSGLFVPIRSIRGFTFLSRFSELMRRGQAIRPLGASPWRTGLRGLRRSQLRRSQLRRSQSHPSGMAELCRGSPPHTGQRPHGRAATHGNRGHQSNASRRDASPSLTPSVKAHRLGTACRGWRSALNAGDGAGPRRREGTERPRLVQALGHCGGGAPLHPPAQAPRRLQGWCWTPQCSGPGFPRE
jgi:hypothetical protein